MCQRLSCYLTRLSKMRWSSLIDLLCCSCCHDNRCIMWSNIAYFQNVCASYWMSKGEYAIKECSHIEPKGIVRMELQVTKVKWACRHQTKSMKVYTKLNFHVCRTTACVVTSLGVGTWGSTWTALGWGTDSGLLHVYRSTACAITLMWAPGVPHGLQLVKTQLVVLYIPRQGSGPHFTAGYLM